MVTRTASLRLQLVDAVSGPSQGVANALSGIDKALSRFGKAGTPEMRRLTKQLEYLQKKAGAIEDFTSSRKGLKLLSTEMRAAQGNFQRLSTAVANAAKPSAALKRELNAAKKTLETTKGAFLQYGQAARQAEGGLRSFGISSRKNISQSQQQIRSEIAKTIREMRRLDQESRKPKPPAPPRRPPGSSSPAYEAVTAATGGYVANQGKTVAEKSFFAAIDFNQAAAYQAALGDFDQQERGTLNRQAEKIGGDTRFSNVDVVNAQTTILQRGIRDTKTIMSLTDKVTDYALAMGVTLQEGAEAVTGSALSKRIDLNDTKAIGNFVDFLVWMAKNGGMSNEDVSQFVKYGGAPTTGAKLPDEYMAAMGMILRRSGVRGDEAGVFARSAVSKLVAPTQKGRDALMSMGIDYNKYTAIDAMNPDGVAITLKNNFGVQMTKEMQAAVKDLMENGEFTNADGETQSVISDSGEFVARMSEILTPLFAGKNGKVAAKDAQALSKMLSNYQKYSVDSVDAVGLLNAIAGSDPTLGNLNAFFTDKQGGRANMIFQQWPLFQEMLDKMRNVPTGVANDIGTKANAELYGDWTKMVGTFETVIMRVGQDFEGATRPVINALNSIGDSFLELDQTSRQVLAGLAGLAVALAGFAALRASGSLLTRLFGGKAGPEASNALVAAGVSGGKAGGKPGGRGGLGLANWLLGLWTAYDLVDKIPNDPEELKKFMAENKAYWDNKNKWLENNIGTPRTLLGMDDGKQERSQAPDQSEANESSLRKQIDGVTASWPLRAKKALAAYGNTLAAGGAEAEAQAELIGSRVEAALSVEGRPTVDASSIQNALDLARQLAAVVSGISGGRAYGTPPNTNSFGGPRANGGPVQAGKTYLVGEKQPELFTPSSNGTIIPSLKQAGGGGAVFHNQFHFHGASEADARKAARVIEDQIRRSSEIAWGGIKPYGD